MSWLLAQDPVDDDLPVVELVDPQRPITELLEGWFGPSPLLELVAGGIDIAVQVVLIAFVAWIVLTLIKRAVRRAVARAKEPASGGVGDGLRRRIGLDESPAPSYSLRRVQRADALGALATSVARVVVWSMAVFIMLAQGFGLNLAPLIAGAGILGVALGFGAQGLVRDFITGIFMLAEDQYGVGDIIDVGEATGVVEGVTLRTTKVRDVTGTLWHVPNGEIHRVGNMSQEWARALLDIAVAYGTDVDAASELILKVASEMAHEQDYADIFLGEPEVWGVEALGNDSVDVRLVIKTQPGQQWAISRELRRRIKNAFDAAEVEIPFPQRTVWLRTEQPVSLGGPDVPAFEATVPDEAAVQRALMAAHRGDTSPPPADLDEALPDPDDGHDGDGPGR